MPHSAPVARHRAAALTHQCRWLKDVVPHAGNLRQHPERQTVRLMASIRQFGFTMPLLVDEAGELASGHGRLEAARRPGMEDVPALVARSWSKAQIKAYRLADNRPARAATWDEDLLRIEIASIIELGETPIEILGWSTAEINVRLRQTPASQLRRSATSTRRLR